VAKVKQDKDKTWVTKAGTVITEEIAEEFADEAERGYDLSDLHRQFVGRPSLGENGVSPRISFRAPPELAAAAQRRADNEDRSLSDLAREALTQYLDS
jgi:Ribbon-helix-helix protein, copG family